MEDMILKLI